MAPAQFCWLRHCRAHPLYLPLLALTSHHLCILMFCKDLSGKISRVLLHGFKPVSLVFSYEQTIAPCLLELLLVAHLSCPHQAPKTDIWDNLFHFSPSLCFSLGPWTGAEQSFRAAWQKPMSQSSGDPKQEHEGIVLSATHLAGLHPPLHSTSTSWKSSLRVLAAFSLNCL